MKKKNGVRRLTKVEQKRIRESFLKKGVIVSSRVHLGYEMKISEDGKLNTVIVYC